MTCTFNWDFESLDEDRRKTDSRTIFTGGSDCLVRIHKANEPDSEPGFHDNHEDAVTSLTCEVRQVNEAKSDRVCEAEELIIGKHLNNSLSR